MCVRLNNLFAAKNFLSDLVDEIQEKYKFPVLQKNIPPLSRNPLESPTPPIPQPMSEYLEPLKATLEDTIGVVLTKVISLLTQFFF